MALTVGSLFSGIGGLDLGLERAGMKVIWQSEIDPYCNKVLKKHWPEVPNYGDIKKIDWGTVERPNVICGGYPCQPFSTAGKRRGTDDARHLWPWVKTAISELQPNYAILENVRGHLSMGGLQVIGELAEIGYDAEWRIVSAAGVGAPHRRDRLIIVAYPNGDYSTNGRECKNVSRENTSGRNDGSGSGSNFREISLGSARENTRNVADADNTRNRTFERRIDSNGSAQVQERQNFAQFRVSRRGANVANTDGERLEGCGGVQEPETKPIGLNLPSPSTGGSSSSGIPDNVGKRHGERWFPTDITAESRIWGINARGKKENDGGAWWQFEPNVGRVAHGVPSRVDRLRGLGNAVVPQVAEYIGRLIINAQ